MADKKKKITAAILVLAAIVIIGVIIVGTRSCTNNHSQTPDDTTAYTPLTDESTKVTEEESTVISTEDSTTVQDETTTDDITTEPDETTDYDSSSDDSSAEETTEPEETTKSPETTKKKDKDPEETTSPKTEPEEDEPEETTRPSQDKCKHTNVSIDVIDDCPCSYKARHTCRICGKVWIEEKGTGHDWVVQYKEEYVEFSPCVFHVTAKCSKCGKTKTYCESSCCIYKATGTNTNDANDPFLEVDIEKTMALGVWKTRDKEYQHDIYVDYYCPRCINHKRGELKQKVHVHNSNIPKTLDELKKYKGKYELVYQGDATHSTWYKVYCECGDASAYEMVPYAPSGLFVGISKLGTLSYGLIDKRAGVTYDMWLTFTFEEKNGTYVKNSGVAMWHDADGTLHKITGLNYSSNTFLITLLEDGKTLDILSNYTGKHTQFTE